MANDKNLNEYNYVQISNKLLNNSLYFYLKAYLYLKFEFYKTFIAKMEAQGRFESNCSNDPEKNQKEKRRKIQQFIEICFKNNFDFLSEILHPTLVRTSSNNTPKELLTLSCFFFRDFSAIRKLINQFLVKRKALLIPYTTAMPELTCLDNLFYCTTRQLKTIDNIAPLRATLQFDFLFSDIQKETTLYKMSPSLMNNPREVDEVITKIATYNFLKTESSLHLHENASTILWIRRQSQLLNSNNEEKSNHEKKVSVLTM